jgi:adenosylcobinamide-GDP ribazoletransferase
VTSFLAALQFLTRVPIRIAAPVPSRQMAAWFPVVGALVGAVVGGVAALAQNWLAPGVSAAVAVAIGMLATGAFHEDGLADLADAIAGGTTRERRLEILKDPRHGTYGVAALCSSVVVRVAVVAAVVDVGPAVTVAVAVSAHALARGVAVGVIGVAPTAAPDGLGASFRSEVSVARAAVPLTIGGGIAAVAVGWWVAPMLGVAAMAAAVLAIVAVRALGGVSGDVAGAAEQVAEIAALLVASALAARHGLWWR